MLRSTLISCLFIFSVSARGLHAQEVPAVETQLLSEKILSELLGATWQGIVYVCDPYCEFISLREVDHWNPTVGERRLRLDKLKTVAKTDPIYPLLISQNPVLPFVEQKAQLTLEEKQKAEEKLKAPPPYALTSYGLGWSLNLGETAELMSLSSNTEIQSELAPKEYFLKPTFSGMLALRPHRFYSYWLQHRLQLQMQTASYSTSDAVSVKTSSQAFTYRVLNFGKRYRTGPRITMRKDEVSVGSDSLTHFSYSWDAYLVGWEIQWRRWSAYLDMSLKSSVKEKQSFREAPLNQTWYRAGVGYCSRDFSVFELSFGLCSQFDYSIDKQKAALASNLSSSTDSQIDISRMEIGISLRVGEDFFK